VSTTCNLLTSALPFLDLLQRYKICPYHLELSQLVVEGQSIRFCQQCGRFQLLEEFDGDRRSCRRKVRVYFQSSPAFSHVCTLKLNNF
jgi:hypothetical protein